MTDPKVVLSVGPSRDKGREVIAVIARLETTETFSQKRQPSLLQVVRKFNCDETCIAHLERIRWPEGLRCIRCGKDRVHRLEAEGKTGKERHLYWCVDCRYQYSVTVGTIFHDSHLPLTKWFLAICMMGSAQNGISPKQLQRELNITYRTAWYMSRRIRLAMHRHDALLREVRRSLANLTKPIPAARARTAFDGLAVLSKVLDRRICNGDRLYGVLQETGLSK